MRKKLLIVIGIFVVVVVLLLMLNLQPASPPRVEMGFYGFTNSASGAEALFAISNRPNLVVVLHSVRRSGTNDSKPDEGELGRWAWSRGRAWGMINAVAVKTTNEPLWVVFEFQQRAAGLRRIPEIMQELWGKLTGNEIDFFTGSKFLVTNETRVWKAPN